MRWGMPLCSGGLVALVFAAGGCSNSVSDSSAPIVLKYAPSQTISMAVGQELQIIVGTLGPGSYDSPAISSPAIMQVPDHGDVLPVTPGGPTQRFSFVAQAAGQAIITLGQSGRTTFRSDTVRDTVIVH